MGVHDVLDRMKRAMQARRDPVQRRERKLRKAHQAAAIARERGRVQGRGGADSIGPV
jgi:hypothetical protein